MRKLLVVAALASSAGCLDFGTYGNDGTGGNWGNGLGSGNGGGSGSGSGSGSGFGAYDMDCPGGSVCSPKTPRGLQFAGAVPIANGFPNAADHNHIAVDGTDDITLKMINADGSASDLAFQYVPLSANDNVLSVDAYSGPIVTLRGLSGTTNLHIIDPETLLPKRKRKRG